MGEDTVEIGLSDLERWINSKIDKELEAIRPQASQIRNKVQNIMNAIKTLSNELKKVEVDPQKVAGQYLPMIKDAKETLLVAVEKETSEQLPEIRGFNDVLAMRDRTKKMLNRLGDTTGAHRRVIHSFFSRHAKVLKFQLGLLNREASNLNRLVDGYEQKASSLSDCIAGISKISSARAENTSLERKSAELKNELETLKTKEAELVRKIEDLQRSEGFRQYETDREELTKARKEAEAMLSEIGAAFSKISRPISKYTYEVGLDKESGNLIQSVMDNPLNLIRDRRVEQLKEILVKVREAAKTGKIVVKNPERDVENIDALMATIDQQIDAYSRSESRVQLMNEKTTPVEADIVRLHRDLERMRSEIAHKESSLNGAAVGLAQARSAVSAELQRIEERIEETTGSRVRIKI